jgi:hypothetical protein
MFGRGWEPGQATIVALKEVRSVGSDATSALGGPKLKTYDFVADVQPDGGGPVFRTVVHEPFDERHWRRPGVGDAVPVKCDPKRQTAKFDTGEATTGSKAQKESEKGRRAAQAAQFDAMVNAAPGTPVPSTAGQRRDDMGAFGDDPELAQLGELEAEEHAAGGKSQGRLGALAQLADLHDRGVLSDLEFAAEKQKILSED